MIDHSNDLNVDQNYYGIPGHPDYFRTSTFNKRMPLWQLIHHFKIAATGFRMTLYRKFLK